MSFSVRLKEERKRLKLTQPQMAERAGTTRQSQLKYEKGVQSPGADYLQAIAALGVDVQYLLTGVRSETALTPEEKRILHFYREAAPAIRKAALAVLESGISSSQSVTIHGDMTGGIVAHTVHKA